MTCVTGSRITLTRVESYPLGPVDGKLTICAESMAEALLPFVRAEIARELRDIAEVYDKGHEEASVKNLEARAAGRSPYAGVVQLYRVRDHLSGRAYELDPEGSTR